MGAGDGVGDAVGVGVGVGDGVGVGVGVGVGIGSAVTIKEGIFAAYSIIRSMSWSRSSAVLLDSVMCVMRNWFGLWDAALLVNSATTKYVLGVP